MNKSPVTQRDNLFSMLYFSRHLEPFEPVIFFGTLLGFVRQGMPIDGDDDVDFYIDRRHFVGVRDKLRSMGFDVRGRYPNISDWFIQVSGCVEGHEVRVDFYFYESDSERQILLERWNFKGQVDDSLQAMRVPSPLFFPLRRVRIFDGAIYVPSYPELICEFLYGPNWREPKKKNSDYDIKVVAGRPVRFAFNHLNQFVLLD